MKNTMKQIALLSMITVGMAQAGIEDRPRRLVTIGYRVKNNNSEVVKALKACRLGKDIVDKNIFLGDAESLIISPYDKSLHRGIFNSECIQRIKETYGEDSITEEKEWQYQGQTNNLF